VRATIQRFKEVVGDWHDLTIYDLWMLEGFLVDALKEFNDRGISLVKELEIVDHFDFEFEDGKLSWACLDVKAHYFNCRTAFRMGYEFEVAPWADSVNLMPFFSALNNFINVKEFLKLGQTL